MVMRNRCLIALSLLSLLLASSAAWAQQPIKAHLVLTTGVFGSKFSGSNAANSDSTSMVTIPMLSEAGCKAEGERWLRRRSRFRKGCREYFCVILC